VPRGQEGDFPPTGPRSSNGPPRVSWSPYGDRTHAE
jgi:hypothetical protein